MFVRAYLRASTAEQDASRARAELEKFADGQGFKIAAFYVENESGASLKRPELFRLLSDCQQGDILLVEQVDRLSRLSESDWGALKTEIGSKGVRVVALDLPTSHQMMDSKDELTAWMMKAINGMLLEMLAAFARKDYEDRRRRQAQGIAKAQAGGRYKGRPVDEKKHQNIRDLLAQGLTWGRVEEVLKVSRSTIARATKA
tara:strand:+ start:2078 stop:2680 length:603 start_codon:yes stop_codon:yes gene_type:complete